MDNLTKIVRTEITRQYKSVRQFAFAVDIPLSTINSALHNGIGGSSFDTVVHICKTLGIKSPIRRFRLLPDGRHAGFADPVCPVG